MKETIKVPIEVMSAEELVMLTLAKHTGADTISIKATIKTVRWLAPNCHETDDDLVELIVAVVADRHLSCVFDHRH